MGLRFWRGRARVLVSGTVASLAAYSVVAIAGAPAAVDAVGCKGTSPGTFLAITQSSAAGSGSGAVFTETVENEGPCNVSGVTFTDTFSQGGAVIAAAVVSTNPSADAATCTVGPAGTSVTVTCTPLNKISAPSDPSSNNPGTVVISISVTPATSSTSPIASTAQVQYAGEFPQDLGYTISHGGFLINGGDIGYPADSSNQSTNLHVNQGQGPAEIEEGVQGPACPTGVRCFGEVVLINANHIVDSGGNPALQTYTFTIPVPKNGPQSTSQVVMLHEPDNGSNWVVVPNCTALPPATPAPDPCVGSILKVKSAAGVSFFVITVYTSINGRWSG